MSYEDSSIVQEWLDSLSELNVKVKKMFGCYCLYCDGQAVGWIHDSVMSLREVGLARERTIRSRNLSFRSIM